MNCERGLSVAHVECGDDTIILRAVEDLGGLSAIGDGQRCVVRVEGGNAVSDGIKVHILRYDCFAEIIPMRGGTVVDPNPVVEVFVDGGDVIVDFDKGGGVDWRSIAGVIFFDKGAIFGNIDGDRVKNIAVCVEVAD